MAIIFNDQVMRYGDRLFTLEADLDSGGNFHHGEQVGLGPPEHI